MSIRTTLGMIAVALAGCAGQETKPEQAKAPQAMACEYISQIENRVLEIDKDGKRDASEAAELSRLYTIVSNTKPAKADVAAHEHYNHLVKMLNGAQNSNCNNMKFYLGFTGCDTAKFGNQPANWGISGTELIGPVTGEQLVEIYGEDAYKIMSKVVPVEKFEGGIVTQGPVNAGGGRIVNLTKYAVRLPLCSKGGEKVVFDEKVGKLVDKANCWFTKERLTELVTAERDKESRMYERGKVDEAWLIGETCKGYNLPKPAEKK
jgi:hypothetical protein